MQKITPCLWFDNQAEEAVNFYTSLFNNSKILNISHYGKEGHEIHRMPDGSVMTVEFEIHGQRFMALNAGPIFKFNPSISFHVKCKTKEEVDAIWAKLSERGAVLMELGEYPFNERYGWCNDKYGLSWQIIFVGESEIKQKITPAIMFVGKVCGKAEEAVNFYASMFHNAKINNIVRHGKGEEPDKEGTVKYAAFTLEGQEFGAMDSSHEHKFNFNEAISFMVMCEDQKEIDHYWNKLSADPKAEMCGWLKDKYGLSWQIAPTMLGKLMQDKDKNRSGRVMKALLQMHKLDIEKLKRAYEHEL